MRWGKQVAEFAESDGSRPRAEGAGWPIFGCVVCWLVRFIIGGVVFLLGSFDS
jgi:hypothetical protein